ncbi:MAG TPA: TMEM175 family protein [Microbacteriaceae bacterium]|nr:TMEM175 family protein [Microbacteriaceae bacterium]
MTTKQHDPDLSARAGKTGTPTQLISRETSEFDRGLSFFDAIYAFAITLLIANVDAPPAEAWHDLGTLLDTGVVRQLGGFALSFVVIAAFWRVNLGLVKRVSAMDSATTTMNLVAAAFVVLIPFTTQGISDPASENYVLPTILYAVNIATASIAQLAMFEVARRRGLETDRLSLRAHTAFVLDWLVVPAVFLASIPVALLWGADAGKITWAALLILGPLSAWLVTRRAARPTPPR